MTTLDVLILAVFVGAVVIGFMRGIIVQVGAVGAVIFGVILARITGVECAQLFAGEEGPTELDIVLGKFLMFIAGYLIVRVIAALCRKITHSLQLGALDRIGGVFFTLFEWMLVLSLLVNLWLVIKPEPPLSELSTLAHGHAAEELVKLAPTVLGWTFG